MFLGGSISRWTPFWPASGFQIDEIGRTFADQKFKDAGVTKVVTIEASGIAPAFTCSWSTGCSMIFAKAKNITTGQRASWRLSLFLYQASRSTKFRLRVNSWIHQVWYVSDFLANGQSSQRLDSNHRTSQGSSQTIGIVIENPSRWTGIVRELGYQFIPRTFGPFWKWSGCIQGGRHLMQNKESQSGRPF